MGKTKTGAGDRSRTYDLRITNALLYQLSYTGYSGMERQKSLELSTYTLARYRSTN